MLRTLDDGLLLMLVVYLFPLVILAVGAPIGLLVWLMREVVERL